MPIRSQAQRAFLHIHHPGIARRWERETPRGRKLPRHVQDDLLPGGKGDDRDASEFDPREISMGIRHEMEHTGDRAVAREIAIDHLTEDPHYYSDMKAAGRLLGGEASESVRLMDFFP